MTDLTLPAKPLTVHTRSPNPRPETEAQKQRRRNLRAAREADRETAVELQLRARYVELSQSMARVGMKIGVLSDLDAISDPQRRFEVLKARVERWEAQWSIAFRKRDTRAKIIIGGAVLAELSSNAVDHQAPSPNLSEIITALLDRRVLAVRDRLAIRELLGAASMALRPGGDVTEDLPTALRNAGETLRLFDLDGLLPAAGEEIGADEDDEAGAAG
jgi:hypothetical protein